MQAFMKIRLLIGVLIIFGYTAQGQTPEQPKKARTVTVTLTDGSVVNATLVGLDADHLSVKSALGESKIEIEKVQKIEFQRAASASPNAESPNEIQAAIKSIRELSTAASGLSLPVYRTRVADLRAKVEEAIRTLPEGDLKKQLRKAVSQHTFAEIWWDLSLKKGGLTVGDYNKIHELWETAKREADAAEQELNRK